MNRTIYTAVVLCALQGVVCPCWAGQTRHHPWFSCKSPLPDAPVVIAHDRSSRPTNDRGHRDDGNRVAQQALRYKGTHYKYGGTTKRGMDCSGLVARVWADLKMKKIPRVSSALYNSGKPVHLSDLRPGDLVFFKNTDKRGISHVGVYAGNNKFVHAANHRKGVTITRLSDPYYQLHYAGARRLY